MFWAVGKGSWIWFRGGAGPCGVGIGGAPYDADGPWAIDAEEGRFIGTGGAGCVDALGGLCMCNGIGGGGAKPGF